MSTVHYVKNKDLTQALKDYRAQPEFQIWLKTKKEAKKKKEPFDEPAPPVTDYIALCFDQIARKYARRPNWSGYTYVEDMISEGTLLCIRYAHNFDPEKSNNAFSYFTQICHNGFLQVINRENKFAKFRFSLAKEQSTKLGGMDYNDINLYDEDNVDLLALNEELEDVEEIDEPNYEKVAEENIE